jgi:hypothetical protein
LQVAFLLLHRALRFQKVPSVSLFLGQWKNFSPVSISNIRKFYINSIKLSFHNNIHKKFIDSDWLRAEQLLGNTLPRKEIQWNFKKFLKFSCMLFL